MISSRLVLILTLMMILPFMGCVSLTKREKALTKDLNTIDHLPASTEERMAIERSDILVQAAFWAKEIEKNPSDLEASMKLVKIMQKIGKPERALIIADQSLTLHPDNQKLMIAFAISALKLNKPENALKALERLLQNNQNHQKGLVLSAICYDRLKQYKQSRYYYQKALSLSPDNSMVLSNLGYSYILSGEPQQAEYYLKKAVQQNEVNSKTKHNLFLSLALQGKYEEAKQWSGQEWSQDEVESNINYIKSMIEHPTSSKQQKNSSKTSEQLANSFHHSKPSFQNIQNDKMTQQPGRLTIIPEKTSDIRAELDSDSLKKQQIKQSSKTVKTPKKKFKLRKSF